MKACEGSYASVARSQVDFLRNQRFLELLEQYETFKHFNETKVEYPNQLQGKLQDVSKKFGNEVGKIGIFPPKNYRLNNILYFFYL